MDRLNLIQKLRITAILIFASLPGITSAQDTVTISRLISMGQVENAHKRLMASNPSNEDKLFFAGQVLKSQQKLDDAIAVFREVLRRDPTYLNARRELAHSLLLNRKFTAAKFHFQELLKIDASPQMRAGYQKFLRVIADNQPWRFESFFALKPSTNINSGTSENELQTILGRFVINEESKAKSGVGMEVGASATFQHAFSGRSQISFAGTGIATRYNAEGLDSDFLRTGATYTRRFSQGKWSLGIFADRLWREDHIYSSSRGGEMKVDWNLGAKNSLSLALSRRLSRYPEQEYKNGPLNRYSATYGQVVSNALSWFTGIGFEEATPQDPHNQYFSQRIYGGLTKSWRGGAITGLRLELGNRSYLGLYPLTTSARDDSYKQISLSAYHSKFQLWGFAPKLSCSYTDQNSNVAFFEFSSTSCSASLSQNF